MIEVRELRKSFDGFEALRGLNIHVPKGAVYGLVGPNGAGKSTVIRHLAGICRQDGGETTSAQTNLEISMTIRSDTASGRSASRVLDVRVCSDSALTLKWLKDNLDLEPTPGLW